MSSNEFDGVEERLHDIERLLARPADELVVVDREELARIPASIEMYRAALALITGDPAGTIAHAERALARRREDDDLHPRGCVGAGGPGVLDHGRPRGGPPRLHGRPEGLRRAGHDRRRAAAARSPSPTSS